MSELKPCPFCGSPAYSYHDNCIDFAGVKCNLGGCVCADILITENNWNTRPIEDALNARIAELEAENAELKAYRDGYHPKEKLPEITKGGYSSEYVTVLCDYSENTKPVFVEACYVNGYDYWKPYSGTGDISRVYRWWPRQKFDRVCAYPLPGGDE